MADWNNFLSIPGWKPTAGLEDLFKAIQDAFRTLPSDPSGQTTATPSGTSSTPPWLDSLIQSLSSSASAGGGGSGSAPAGYMTPDGHWISDNSPEDVYYKMVDAIWTRLYGSHPPFSMVRTFHDLGVENTSQLDTIMKQMPSHIRNPDGSRMSIGQYDVMKGTGEQLSDKYLGRPIPDSLIQQWVNAGQTSPEAIEMWFFNHPAKDIPKDVYGTIFDQAVGIVQNTWKDLPHPDHVAAIYNGMQPPK